MFIPHTRCIFIRIRFEIYVCFFIIILWIGHAGWYFISTQYSPSKSHSLRAANQTDSRLHITYFCYSCQRNSRNLSAQRRTLQVFALKTAKWITGAPIFIILSAKIFVVQHCTVKFREIPLTAVSTTQPAALITTAVNWGGAAPTHSVTLASTYDSQPAS